MTKDMTNGSPIRLIVGFAVPMFFGMLFQQFYSMVDTIVVGKFLGVGPLAGVGSTGSINFLVIGFCVGICSGFAIPIAQMFGAGREEELRKYVANSIWLCVFFAVVLTFSVTALCRPILRLMNTPEDVFEYAYTYILIIFWGIPFTLLYNAGAAVLRSLGDSRTPVIFLVIASLTNIALDLLFILVLGMGVEGPALATVISQGFSGMICLWYMRKNFTILRMTKEERKIRGAYIRQLCYMGIPMGLQYSVTAIGSIVVQTAINGFGSTIVAGVTAAQRLSAFLSCPVESIGATMAPYAGQNIGAGKPERVEKGLRDASLLGFVFSGILLLIVMVFGKQLSMFFIDTPDDAVVDASYRFLRFCAGGYCLLTLVNAVRFTIQGMGFSVFAIISGVMEMIARVLAATVLVPMLGYTGVCLAHPMAWLFADAFLIPAFFHCMKKIRRLYD